MTEELGNTLDAFLQGTVKNIVLNLEGVDAVDEVVAEWLARTQQQFYEGGASFVICALKPAVEDFLDKRELLELMNVTPTESEAYDIVQMEEIERELLGDEEAGT